MALRIRLGLAIVALCVGVMVTACARPANIGTDPGPVERESGAPSDLPAQPHEMPVTVELAHVAVPSAADESVLPKLTIGDSWDFPAGVAMVIETGCTQCDGPTEALY